MLIVDPLSGFPVSGQIPALALAQHSFKQIQTSKSVLIIFKMKLWINIKRFDPVVDKKPQHFPYHHPPKKHPQIN